MGSYTRKWAAIATGIFLALAFQLALSWYRVNRGYGNEPAGYALDPGTVQDYDITDRQWTPLGDTAMILFQTGNLGHIHLSLKEPLKEDTAVVLYFQENPDSQFDRFRRICRYMMRGTREADLTVLPGPWQSFRLEIRGDFSPEKITLIPAADPSSVSAATIFKQMRLLQTVVFCLFCASGMYLWFGYRKTAARTRKNNRILWLDMLRTLAAGAMRMDPWLKPLKQLLSLCSRYSYSVLLIHWYVLNTFIYSGWLSSGLSASLQILLPILACLVISLSLSVITDRLVTDVVKSIGGRLLPHRASGSPPPR